MPPRAPTARTSSSTRYPHGGAWRGRCTHGCWVLPLWVLQLAPGNAPRAVQAAPARSSAAPRWGQPRCRGPRANPSGTVSPAPAASPPGPAPGAAVDVVGRQSVRLGLLHLTPQHLTAGEAGLRGESQPSVLRGRCEARGEAPCYTDVTSFSSPSSPPSDTALCCALLRPGGGTLGRGFPAVRSRTEPRLQS